MKKRITNLKPWVFWLIYIGVIAATILIDQLTKYYIEIAVANHNGRIRILGDWLTLVWTTNDGATGGIFQELEWRNILFFVMTLVGLPVFGFMLWRSRTRSVWGQVAFSFMIGGTIGNAIDRLFLVETGGEFFSGAVRDFIQVQNFFGIFNMADSFLVVGVILALLAIIVFDPDSLVAAFIAESRAKQEQPVAEENGKNDVKISTTKISEQRTVEQTNNNYVKDVTEHITDDKSKDAEQNDADD